jgi:hypothetical protein
MAIHGNRLRKATVIITSQLVKWYRQVSYCDVSGATGRSLFSGKADRKMIRYTASFKAGLCPVTAGKMAGLAVASSNSRGATSVLVFPRAKYARLDCRNLCADTIAPE